MGDRKKRATGAGLRGRCCTGLPLRPGSFPRSGLASRRSRDGFPRPSHHERHGRESRRADLARIYYFNGTFAYLITPAACRSLSGICCRHWHIDHQISKVLFEQRKVFPAYYTEPHFFEPDWSLRSDCYVPIAEETNADRELGRILDCEASFARGGDGRFSRRSDRRAPLSLSGKRTRYIRPCGSPRSCDPKGLRTASGWCPGRGAASRASPQ